MAQPMHRLLITVRDPNLECRILRNGWSQERCQASDGGDRSRATETREIRKGA